MSQSNWGGGGAGGWGGGPPSSGGGGGWGGGPPPGGGGFGPPPGGGGGGFGPPPGGGGFGPPPGGGGGGLVPQGPAAVQERNSALVLVLSFVTCGVYWFYWIYKTSDELQRQTGDTSINPGIDLLLTLVTCGMWGMYVEYRNAQKIHARLVMNNPYRSDQSQTILILNLASFVVGVTGFVAMYMLQEELNQLARGGSPALPR